jgi:hypothetical protein
MRSRWEFLATILRATLHAMGRRVLGGDEDILYNVDDLRALAVRPELEGGIGESLGGEQVALGRIDETDAENAPKMQVHGWI